MIQIIIFAVIAACSFAGGYFIAKKDDAVDWDRFLAVVLAAVGLVSTTGFLMHLFRLMEQL